MQKCCSVQNIISPYTETHLSGGKINDLNYNNFHGKSIPQ